MVASLGGGGPHLTFAGDTPIARTLQLIAVSFVLAACVNPNRMFTGRWVALDAVELPGFSGTVELALGHFGPDLVGVARGYDAAGLPEEGCPCAIVEARSVRIGDGSFQAVVQRCDGSTWLLSLVIDLDADPLILAGTVTPGGAALGVPVTFEQLDASVDSGFRECDP